MPESYSVNQLKTWSKCQKKYEFDYVRRLLWPTDPKNFRLGKGVHQLLDYSSRDLPLDTILEFADPDIQRVYCSLRESYWANLPIIASEWGFSLEIEGKWLYGRIDRIVRENEKIHILDWKTGTGIPLSPEEDWQTLVYLYAVYLAQRDLKLSIVPENLIFTYVHVGNQGAIKTIQIQYSEALHFQIAKRLSETLNILQTAKEFLLPLRCPDKFCPYSHICGIKAQGKEPLYDDGAILSN